MSNLDLPTQIALGKLPKAVRVSLEASIENAKKLEAAASKKKTAKKAK